MTLKIHRHFIRTARGISAPLHAAIAQVGRVTMPERRARSLARFLSRAIVGQQLSTSAARSIWARVEAAVKTQGSSIPEFFSDKNTRVLRRCGISRAKVKALIAIREAQENGVLSIRRLRRLSHAERSEQLQEIWGIGQWTADMTSIFFFGDPDVWPEGDISVQSTFLRLTGKRSRATALKMASSFAPYRSFLALYMWQVLDGPRKTEKRKPLNQKRPV
jgi:DNA-3-methyladenine glycosylase II